MFETAMPEHYCPCARASCLPAALNFASEFCTASRGEDCMAMRTCVYDTEMNFRICSDGSADVLRKASPFLFLSPFTRTPQ